MRAGSRACVCGGGGAGGQYGWYFLERRQADGRGHGHSYVRARGGGGWQINDRSFGVEHLRELALAAAEHLQEAEYLPVWNVIIDVLLTVGANDEAPLRNQASDALADVCLSVLAHVTAGAIERDPELQLRVISPLLRLAESPSSDAQLRQLGTLYKILQTAGQAFAAAWPAILETLAKVRARPRARAPVSAHACLAHRAAAVVGRTGRGRRRRRPDWRSGRSVDAPAGTGRGGGAERLPVRAGGLLHWPSQGGTCAFHVRRRRANADAL